MKLRPSCTIDSSCLINLDQLDLLPQLSFLFKIVLVPKAVREEIFRRAVTKDRMRLLFDRYAFFRRCNDYDQGAVDYLLVGRIQDRGEAEAVVQASQFGAIVIVDDTWGRELAGNYDLEFHGTVWVLQRFLELELLSSTALRECFLSLLKSERWLPWDAVNDLLQQIGEEPV